jgi:hypothetical protein
VRSPPGVLALQRAAGNRAVARLMSRTSGSNGPRLLRQKIAVGFGRYAHGGEGDVLVTAGLANCVALVAYNRESKKAAMAHYDTGTLYDTLDDKFDTARLASFKRTLDSLVGATDENPAEHFVGMGSVWTRASTETSVGMRQALTSAVWEVFPDVSTIWYSEGAVSFNVATGSVTYTSEEEVRDLLPEGWNVAGEEIDYSGMRSSEPSLFAGMELTTDTQ